MPSSVSHDGVLSQDRRATPCAPDTIEDPASFRRRRGIPAAELAHFASLAAALALLLRVGRYQWFFGDEWDFLVQRGVTGAKYGLFQPHNEHWSTVPILLYRALFSLFGVRTYTPYLTTILLFHLTTVHILWRVLRRTGVSPWLATALVWTFLVGGAGAEDLMWAFQVGFVGALLFGLALLLLVNDPDASHRRDLLARVTAMTSLAFSGVAVPMVAMAGALAWMRRGGRAALRFAAPPAAVYLVWLVFIGHEGLGAHETTRRGLLLVPQYTWRGLVATVEGYATVERIGPVILLALGYVLLRRTGWARTRAAAAPAGALGALFLFLTVAPGRVTLGIDQSQSSRYQYLAWALLLPAVGICLQQAVGGHRIREFVLVALAAACAVYGLDSLTSFAENEGRREQSLRRTIVAAAELAASGAPVFPLPPHPVFAPDLAPPSKLVQLLRAGDLQRPSDLGPSDRLAAAAALQVRLPPQAALPVGNPSAVSARQWVHASVLPAPTGCMTLRPDGGRPELSVNLSGPSGLGVTSSAGGELRVLLRDPATGQTVDPGLVVALTAGATASIDLAVTDAVPVLLLPATGDTTLCGFRPAP